MSRDVTWYLDDMVDACRRIARYGEGLNREDLKAGTMAYDATVRNLEILGEACKGVPAEVRAAEFSEVRNGTLNIETPRREFSCVCCKPESLALMRARLRPGGQIVNAVALRRWSRKEYGRMIDAGLLTTEDQVELVDGEVVTMTPQKSRHATAVRLAEIALRRAFREHEQVDLRTQLPLALEPDSEPEPDIAVVTGSPRDYRDEHPSTALLILEVAETSLAFDRTTKAGLYARAGVADYWVLNLAEETLEVYRTPESSTDAPRGWRYAIVRRFGAREGVAPLARPDCVISVADLLP